MSRKKLVLPDWRDPELKVRHQCESKKAYHSPQEARKAIKIMKRCARSIDGRVHHYRCNICRLWHVGTVSKRPRAPRKKERYNIMLTFALAASLATTNPGPVVETCGFLPAGSPCPRRPAPPACRVIRVLWLCIPR